MTEQVQTYPNDTHVSPHLRWDELSCHDAARTPYPQAWRASRGAVLGQAFEAVREACGGRPIVILSGYRTREHNVAVGGAGLSQHVEGRALDLRTPAGLTRAEFERRIRRALPVLGGRAIRGLGIYPWGCHIDIRLSTHLVVWKAQRSEDVR